MYVVSLWPLREPLKGTRCANDRVAPALRIRVLELCGELKQLLLLPFHLIAAEP
jgi:hypothetical protein